MYSLDFQFGLPYCYSTIAEIDYKPYYAELPQSY